MSYQQERDCSPKPEHGLASLPGHIQGLFLPQVVVGEQVEGIFSEAYPIVWVTGNALLAGTYSAHWVDVTAATRLSQPVKDSLSFFSPNAEACLCVNVSCVKALVHVCTSSSACF